MRVFFSAGEASGDAYAAQILQRLQPEPLQPILAELAAFKHDEGIDSPARLEAALRASHRGLSRAAEEHMIQFYAEFQRQFGVDVPPGLGHRETIEFIHAHLLQASDRALLHAQGVGGGRLEDAGAEIVADSSRWGAVGIIESIKVSPRVIAGYYAAKRAMRTGRPGLFVPIDFGFMNIKLARYAKRKGWKVLYFIPPGSWRKTKQGADLPAVTDAIVTPFPWSAKILNEMGANAHYFGHPLKEMVGTVPDAEVRTGIAVLPGSRGHEIEQNVPVIAQAIELLPGPVRIAVAPNADEREIEHAWLKWSDHTPILSRETYSVLKSSRAAVVCSGTATLEAALCGCPCVVVYRGNKVMEFEYRLRRPKFDYISLPNILLDRPLLKELIQWDATVPAIRDEATALLAEGPRREEVLVGFREIYDSLGPTDCLERTAALARSMLD
ncbi:MAG TPA: hypothetical protein VNI20_11040 [Fimbriimonadaceae bacterium]|nr:hypothetical protein [Fimbriimonadaceae bacterium]